jgi:hypothetical protein
MVAGGVARYLATIDRGVAKHAARRPGTLAAMAAALSHGIIDLSYAVPDLMLVWVLLTMLPMLDTGISYPPNEFGV